MTAANYQPLGNLGRVETSGWDFGLNWLGPDMAWGRFGVNWNSTYVNDYSAQSIETGLFEPAHVGVEVTDSGIARVRSTLHLTWALADWSATWSMRYISDLTEDCGAVAGFPVCNGPVTAQTPDGSHHLGAVTYHDIRASWKVPVSTPFTLSAGINNMFARDPPVCLSCSLNGYDASNYDLPGRFWYVEANLKF